MAPSKKTMLFVCLLIVAVAVVVPVAQGGLVICLSKLIHVGSTIFCSVNGNATVGSGGVVISPPFRSAFVELRCRPGNTLVSTAMTNSRGEFSIILTAVSYSVPQVLNTCRVVVATPLAKRNPTLSATGTLTSKLTSNGTLQPATSKSPCSLQRSFHSWPDPNSIVQVFKK